MSKATYLQAQITRVRDFANWCGKYTWFAQILTTMANAINDKHCEPLAIQELWCFEFSDPSTDHFIRVGKIRTVDEDQSKLPGCGNWTEIIYTMPSLIADEEEICKMDFAIRLSDELDKVSNTGMERIMETIKEQILIELLQDDVEFAGMNEGSILTYAGVDIHSIDPRYLHARTGNLFRPSAKRWLIVDGVVCTKWP